MPNTEKDRDNAPDFRILAGTGYEIGAAGKKTSRSDKPYIFVTLDDPSFPATIYARPVQGEGEGDTHDLIWSRSKGD